MLCDIIKKDNRYYLLSIRCDSISVSYEKEVDELHLPDIDEKTDSEEYFDEYPFKPEEKWSFFEKKTPEKLKNNFEIYFECKKKFDKNNICDEYDEKEDYDYYIQGGPGCGK